MVVGLWGWLISAIGNETISKLCRELRQVSHFNNIIGNLTPTTWKIILRVVIWIGLFKIHTCTNISNVETASPKTIQTLKILYPFCDNCKTVKSHHSPTISKKWRWKSQMFGYFLRVSHLHRFGGHCLKSKDICMDFEPCFKVYNLVSVQPKSIKLGQMTILSMGSFMCWCQCIDFSCLSSLCNFQLNFITQVWAN